MKSQDQTVLRQKIATLLWEKQFEGTPWQSKIHLIAPRSLEPYREFADSLIKTVRLHDDYVKQAILSQEKEEG